MQNKVVQLNKSRVEKAKGICVLQDLEAANFSKFQLPIFPVSVPTVCGGRVVVVNQY